MHHLFARGAVVLAVTLLATKGIIGETSDSSEESLNRMEKDLLREFADYTLKGIHNVRRVSLVELIARDLSVNVADHFRTVPSKKMPPSLRPTRLAGHHHSKAESAYYGNADDPHNPRETTSADDSTSDGSRKRSACCAVPTPNSPWVRLPPGAERRRPELCVDRVLLGKLSTENDLIAVWGDYDGSFVHGSRSHVLVDGEQGRFKREVVLIKPSPEKIDEVYYVRAMLRKMEAELAGGATGSRTAWTDEELKMAKTAKENLRHVDVVLSKRACLTVSIDGICVLERSGRFEREWMNQFPWRWREADTYVLRATEDGFEVVDGDRRVWGISAGDVA